MPSNNTWTVFDDRSLFITERFWMATVLHLVILVDGSRFVCVLYGRFARCGVILAKTTQSRHFFGHVWISSMLLVALFLKSWFPCILDVPNP